SIEQKNPAFVELFTAENVKVIESEVVELSFPTGFPFPSSAESILVSSGSSNIIQSNLAGVSSSINRFPLSVCIITYAFTNRKCGPGAKSLYSLLPMKLIKFVEQVENGSPPSK